MQEFISKIFNSFTQHMLGLTLYDMMQSSNDFEDVMVAFKDRIDWSIELFRSSFTIHLINGNYFFMLSTLPFLVMAENIRLHYGRLSPAALKEHAERLGYTMFAILFAALDIGFVIVRVAGLVAVSGSSALATSLVLVSMSPSLILPVLTYSARLLRQRERESTHDVEAGSGAVVNETGI